MGARNFPGVWMYSLTGLTEQNTITDIYNWRPVQDGILQLSRKMSNTNFWFNDLINSSHFLTDTNQDGQ